MGVLRDDDRAGRLRISDRLVEVAGTVPDQVEGFNLGGHGAEIFDDTRFTDVTAYPAAMWKQPGEKAPEPGRAGGVGRLGERLRPSRSTAGRCSSPARRTWPSRPTSPASPRTSAELPGWGWYNRDTNLRGALLPQQITEFTNAGVSVGHRHRQPGR